MECATQQMKNTQNGGLIVIGETVVTLHRETPGAKVCITTDIYKIFNSCYTKSELDSNVLI